MFRDIRFFLAITAFVLTPSAILAQTAAEKQEEAAKAVATLKQTDAPEFDKVMACKRLAVIGTKEAVPVLSGMLADEKMAHYARYALEPIPDPAVDQALRDALGKLKGNLLIGAIGSIGHRKDAQATEASAKLTADADVGISGAAAAALGRIGTPESAKLLKEKLTSAAPGLRGFVADAALVCSEELLVKGKRDEAVAVYDAVRAADLAVYQRVAGMRGAILARQAAGVALLTEQLQSSDKAMFGVALRAARELPAKEIGQALLAQVDKVPAERKALVIAALADRGDAAVLPAALEAARNGAGSARVAAIGALLRLRDASAVPVLVDAASASDSDVVTAALNVLGQFEGKEVDAALVAEFAKAVGPKRSLLLELLGQRRMAAAVPELMKAVDADDPAARLSAFKALGQMIALEDFPKLIGRLANPKSPEEGAAVRDALKTSCLRVPDQAACTEKLLVAAAQSPVAVRITVMEILPVVGGPKALATVVAAARDADAEIQDAATRILGEWMSPDAAPDLLNLAKTHENPKYKIRALRGYIRIIRQLELPADEKLKMANEVMAICERDADKKLVLDALSRVQSPQALSLVVSYAGNAALQKDAAKSALTIGDKILQSQPGAVAESMQKLLDAQPDAETAQKAGLLLKQAKARARRK